MQLPVPRPAPIAAAALVVALSALNGCGSDAGDDTDAAPSESPTLAETSDAASEGAGSGRLTSPGTSLAIGDRATVPFDTDDSSGVVAIVVDRIEKGNAAHLRALDLQDQADGYVPYFVSYTVTGVRESRVLRKATFDESVIGILADGSGAQALRVIGDWEPCDGTSAPKDFADGSTFSSCVPYLAEKGSDVVGAQFAPTVGDYNAVDGEPVTWR